MKALFFSALLALTALSCERTATEDATITQVTTSGTWKVSLFSERGNDETSDFAGYTFTFKTDGSLLAVKNGSTTTGTWSLANSSTQFNINLGPKSDLNKPLGELTDDWKVLSNTTTEIKLTDDNASSAEFLTFSRN